MHTIWGVILIVVSSLAYFGQVIAAIRPELASRLGLAEVGCIEVRDGRMPR